MANPLHLLGLRQRRVPARRRRDVRLPTTVASTDAVFLVLRRLRRPMMTVLVVFTICTIGMALMPGPADHPEPMSIFDAFYQMSITVTTVGYSEVPYSFSYPQRMWQVGSLYALVVCWAYAVGALFAMMQDPSFQEAMALQRFRRQVRTIREPFFIICGFGQAGRRVGLELDEHRLRFVVLDNQRARIESLLTEPLSTDVPAVEADCKVPAMLGMAGLRHPACVGVLALTDDDEANLAVVMAASVLRPDVPVIARCTDRDLQFQMEDFAPAAIINTNDRYGGYLALAIQKPVVHQLLQWLMDNDEEKLPRLRTGLGEGRWVVAGEGSFADEVTRDLRASGIHAEQVDAKDATVVAGATGFVAGTDNDTRNIALAEHARLNNPHAYVCVRQQSAANAPILAALDADSTFVPTDLIAREVLARIVRPRFWTFVEKAVVQSDGWAQALRDKLADRCSDWTPERDLVKITMGEAPAVMRWIRGNDLPLGRLLAHPDDRDHHLHVVCLMITRGSDHLLAPDDDTLIRAGDELLLAGTATGLADLSDVLFSDATVEYLATGRQVPATWLWRLLSRRR